MHKSFLVIGAVLGAIAVGLGAFGAHGLQKVLTDEKIIQSFRTGVQYQLYHALALLTTAIIFFHYPNKKIKWAGTCFIAGIIFFSGSLYLITGFKIMEIDGVKYLAPVTPLGGILLIAGWILLVWGIAKKK